jgi:AraC-like DNA-binding protein
VKQAREHTISARLIVPFLEVTGSHPMQLTRLQTRGIGLADLANPEQRVSCRVAGELLREAVAASGDATLGLKAGEAIDPLDVTTLAARSCATLRDAIACVQRFMALSDESLRAQLVEEGTRAIWRSWHTEDLDLPAINDFTLASACALIRACTMQPLVLLEVHFKHRVASDSATYARVFAGAEIKLGMPCNALVFRRSALDQVLTRAHPGLQTAFEARASSLLRRLQSPANVTERVQQVTAAQWRAGEASMSSVARELGVSVATLRRHLQREGIGFSDIDEEVRRGLAEDQLSNTDMPVSEVARSLGFSHAAAFYRAFRRWFAGMTPTELRARARATQH